MPHKLVFYTKIIEIRDQKVILDNSVAELYGVETKRINEAVSRNPEKSPDGYLIELTSDEWVPLKSQFATSPLGGGRLFWCIVNHKFDS